MNVRISGNQIGFDSGPVRARGEWLGREIPDAVPVKGACLVPYRRRTALLGPVFHILAEAPLKD